MGNSGDIHSDPPYLLKEDSCPNKRKEIGMSCIFVVMTGVVCVRIWEKRKQIKKKKELFSHALTALI